MVKNGSSGEVFAMRMPENGSHLSQCFCSDMTVHDYSSFYGSFNLAAIILALPILSAFGFVSNIVNIFIFTRESMRRSANTYLLALATSDFMVLATGLCSFWLDSARSYLPSLKHAPYAIICMLPVGYTAQSCSVYFTVAAAIDCYIRLCWSSVWPRYNTVQRSRQIVGLIVVFSCVYNSLRLGQFTLRECKPGALSGTTSIVEICPTPLYFHINEIYNVYLYMALMAFLPFFLLLFLTALIILRLGPEHVRTVRRRSSVIQGGRILFGLLKINVGSDDTITMIIVVVMFLACNTLALVVNIVETFMDPNPLVLNYMTDASNFLIIFNSSVNFVIYVIFSKEFLHLFKRYFCRCYDTKQPVEMENEPCSPPTNSVLDGPFASLIAAVKPLSQSAYFTRCQLLSTPMTNNKRRPPFVTVTEDSGSPPSYDQLPTTSYLAEVNIVASNTSVRPLIVIRPIDDYFVETFV